MKKVNLERLQKVISKSGVASRRHAEELIANGRVRVNGETVKEMGYKVKPRDAIEIDGKVIGRPEELVYIVLYKPVRVLTTVSDPQGRKTVMDLLAGVPTRVYPVGRLDYETSGLLILTNDGEMAHRLMHPAFSVNKTYEALIDGVLSQEDLFRLRKGVVIEGKKTSPAMVYIKGGDGNSTKLEITIHEGRNRQVRMMIEAVDHMCLKLTRIRYGPLRLQGLRPGQWRELTPQEVNKLQEAKPENRGW